MKGVVVGLETVEKTESEEEHEEEEEGEWGQEEEWAVLREGEVVVAFPGGEEGKKAFLDSVSKWERESEG
jgi:hypothetical protein